VTRKTSVRVTPATIASSDLPVGAIVKRLVQSIPKGNATSYGAIARAATVIGRPIGGARTVSWILATVNAKENIPWHRVVGRDGLILLPDRRGALQASRLRKEGVRVVKGVVEPAFLMDGAELVVRATRSR
jgi:methylated-DNA-protein-cysteine methyltransferase-like protein